MSWAVRDAVATYLLVLSSAAAEAAIRIDLSGGTNVAVLSSATPQIDLEG